MARSFGNPHFVTPILCEGSKELMREAGEDPHVVGHRVRLSEYFYNNNGPGWF